MNNVLSRKRKADYLSVRITLPGTGKWTEWKKCIQEGGCNEWYKESVTCVDCACAWKLLQALRAFYPR